MQRKILKCKARVIVGCLCAALSAILVMAASMQVSAAEERSTITVLTMQRCSIWNAPATAEENRVKYVDAGYQITVYPEVVASVLGDGKTFYRTVRGAYVLCRCVTDGSGNEAAGTAGEAGAVSGKWAELTAALSGVQPPVPDPVSVYSERIDKEYGGYEIKEYDAFGNLIRFAFYDSDGRQSQGGYTVCEYDAFGNEIKAATYNDDNGNGTPVLVSWYYSEYDENGVKKKDVAYYKGYDNEIGIQRVDIFEDYNEAIGLPMQMTRYYPDGSYSFGRREVFQKANGYSYRGSIRLTRYYPDGRVKDEGSVFFNTGAGAVTLSL